MFYALTALLLVPLTVAAVALAAMADVDRLLRGLHIPLTHDF